MRIIKRDMNGRFNEMDIDITPDQMEKWREGMPLRHVMPKLTMPEQIFLLTGVKINFDDKEK